MSKQNAFREKFHLLGELGVEKTKFFRYCQYAMKIETLLENSEPIPTPWLKTLLSYFKNVEQLESEYYQNLHQEKIKTLTDEAIVYFKVQDGYRFSGEYQRVSSISWSSMAHIFEPPPDLNASERKKKTGQKKKTIVRDSPTEMGVYSLETMLSLVIGNYLTLQEKQTSSKEESILFFDRELKNYCDTYFNVADKKNFTKYMRQIISGYLTIKVGGYFLSEKLKNDFTNQNIYQATRNAFRHKKRKA